MNMKPTALGPRGVNYAATIDDLDETITVHLAVFAMGIVKNANDTEEFYRLRALRSTGLAYPEAVEQSERAYWALMEHLDQRHLTARTERE